MDWFWDPIHRQEVCYRKGLEYMRYGHGTMKYLFPDLPKISMEGEMGLPDESTRESISSVLVESPRTEGRRKAPFEQHLERTILAGAPSFQPSPIDTFEVFQDQGFEVKIGGSY